MNKRYHYAELDKVIAKSRRNKEMKKCKEMLFNGVKFTACAVGVYAVGFLTWCTLCAMFPAWP